MTALKDLHRISRKHLYIGAVLMVLACAVLIAYARVSGKGTSPFALADDLPRGALLYAQLSDLPGLVKQWNDSKLKENYLSSTNFKQFQSRHLALKLIERWGEFNDALGFPLDDIAIGEAAGNKAALAIYDFGRLEMVFVAPVSEDKWTATKFFLNKDQFEETELPDGTLYYSREIDAEGGRRKQKFAFAFLRGRIVLATNEQFLLRTLANINAKTKNDRLSDDLSFRTLSSETTPHLMTVWMDQSKLNNDWYFKQYWVMRNVDQLKNIRASMLDLELKDDRWVEHRDFLLSAKIAPKTSAVPTVHLQRILSFIPDDVPYFQIKGLNDPVAAMAIVRHALLDRSLADGRNRGGSTWDWRSYDDSDFYPDESERTWQYDGYGALDSKFDSVIDNASDARVDSEEAAQQRLRRMAESRDETALKDSLQSAVPLYVTTVEGPRPLDGPLFTEFRRGSILTLKSPGGFRQGDFESSIARLAEGRLMIAGPKTTLTWSNERCGTDQCRGLTLPMLGWGMHYILKGTDLILANSPEMLRDMLAGGSASRSAEPGSVSALQDLTVIRLDHREQAFDSTMNKLDAPNVEAYWKERKKQQGESGDSQEFFSGEIASLLNVASSVREIRITRSAQSARLREEVEMRFK